MINNKWVSSIETGPEGGQITIADNQKIKKILKL